MRLEVFFRNNAPVHDASMLPVGLIQDESTIKRIVAGEDTETIALDVILFHPISTGNIGVFNDNQLKLFFIAENREDGDKVVVNVLDSTKEVISGDLNVYQCNAKLVLQGCGRYQGQVCVEKGYVGKIFVFNEDACLGIETPKGLEDKPHCVSLLTGEFKSIPDNPFWFRGWDMPYVLLQV